MPSLGIAPAPEDCSRYLYTLPQGLAPVTGVFPAGVALRHLEIGLEAVQLSPYRTVVSSPSAPGHERRFRWHAVVPFLFRGQVSHKAQGYHLQSLPTSSGICQSASWRETGRRTTHQGKSTWHSRCNTAKIELSFTRSATKLAVPFIRSAWRGASPTVTAPTSASLNTRL